MSTPPKQETRFCLTPESTGLGMSAKPPQCSTPTSLSAPSLLASRCPLSAPPPAPVPVPGAGGCAAPQRRAILVGETPATSRTALACDDVARLPQRGQCTHRAHDDGLRGVASTAALPTEHYRVQLERCRRDAERNGCDAAKINGQMNDIFLKRLKDIDDCASGNNDLRLITYQEWVDMLLHINVVLISNMEDLEAEVQERLQLAESRLPCQCRTNSAGSELAKARKDICSLLKVIQNGYHNDNWNLQGMHFETVTHAQVLGKMCMQPDNSRLQAGLEADTAHNTQYNKLMVNMKALAIEVADKHDELREMKKQVLCLEDEIQNAQKKIQLKDDVIKELRNDLKQLNTQNAAPSSSETASVSVCESDMKPPANCEAELSSGLVTPTHSSTLSTCNKVAVFQAAVTDMTTPFESLANNEQLEKQKLRELETELTQLFAMSKGKEMLSLNEAHRKSFLDIFQRSESEKAMAYRKLDYIRRQLVDLETNSISHNGNSEADGAMSVVSMKAENDQDAKILESLRKRISKLNESTFGLKKQVQELEIEKNVLSTDLQTERKFSERNQATLREVADLLCGMSGEQFSYKDIYSDQSKANPFCETILKLRENFDRLLEKDGANLMQKEEKIKDLEQVLCGFKCELQQTPISSNTNTETSRGTITTTIITGTQRVTTTTTTQTTQQKKLEFLAPLPPPPPPPRPAQLQEVAIFNKQQQQQQQQQQPPQQIPQRHKHQHRHDYRTQSFDKDLHSAWNW